MHRTLAVTLVLLLGTAVPLTASFADRPNILVILTDDMGYSDLGCYGGEIETPNLDRLASNGIRFTQMYNTSKCWTTRISLLTGLYHQRSDRDFRNTAMAGEVLGSADYRTWWVGKHHASFNPCDRGFDHFSGFLGGAINFWNPSDVARDGEPAPGWRASYTWAFDDKLVKPFVPDKSFYATDAFTDWALQRLESRDAQSGEQERPFFLYVAYNAPHWPLHAHAADIKKYDGVYDAGYEAIRSARHKRQIESGLFDPASATLSPPDHAAWAELSEQERTDEALRMQIHAAMVDRVDQNVGRLIAKLQEIGELENTLILFLVDNGASHERPRSDKKSMDAAWGTVGSFEAIGQSWANVANAPLRKWKICSTEGGINTPMIAHWPRGITAKSGSICRQPCHLVDLLPTFVELAGDDAKYPGDIAAMDGVSLTPTFRGPAIDRRQPLFFQYGSWQALRDGDWKLVKQKSDPWQLYNLNEDRTETRDLATQLPDRVKAMEHQWLAWYRECTGREWSGLTKKSKQQNKKSKKTTRAGSAS